MAACIGGAVYHAIIDARFGALGIVFITRAVLLFISIHAL